MLAALQVDEIGERQPGALDGLRRRPRDGEEEGPVGLGDLTVVVPVDHHRSDGVVGHDQGDDGKCPEAFRPEGRVDVGSIACQVVDGLGEEGDVLTQDRSVGLQGGQHAVRRVVGVVPEPAQCAQHAPLVEQGECGRIHAQLVSHGGKDRVGHLGRVGGGRQSTCHGLHPLCRLGRDAPAPFVPRLRAGPPELHVALPAQVRDPHRDRGCRQHRHDAQQVVELAVAVRGRADHEREEGSQDADEGDPRGTREGRGDEG